MAGSAGRISIEDDRAEVLFVLVVVAALVGGATSAIGSLAVVGTALATWC